MKKVDTNFSLNKEILTKVKKESKVIKGGIEVFSDNDSKYLYDKLSNIMVLANSSSNKEENIIAPSIEYMIEANESFIINDMHYKMYNTFYDKLKENGYLIKILNLDDPTTGNSFNPLLLPYNLYKDNKNDLAINILEDIANNIFNDDGLDPYWNISASNYFIGLVLYLFENAKEDEINFASIVKLSETFGLDTDNDRKKIIEDIIPNSRVYNLLKGTLLVPYETSAGIISTFNQKMNKIVSRDNLMATICNDDFNLESICNEKTAMFVINGLHNNKMFIPILINEVFYAKFIYGNHKNRMNFILDDFNNIDNFGQNFPNIISKAEDINMRFIMCIDSYNGIIDKYGKELGNLIMMNFPINIYLYTNDLSSLEKFSNYCGNVSINELKLMGNNKGIILIPRMDPFMVKFPDYSISSVKKDIIKNGNKEIKIYLTNE